MDFKTCSWLIKSDLNSYHGAVSRKGLLKELLFGFGFKYTFWLRLSRYFHSKSKLFRPCHVLARLVLRHYMVKFGIDIPWCTELGGGFYIGHFGGIVVSGDARIGRNYNISQGVTIGISQRGARQGAPIIGDNVYIGPGAKLFGAIKVGNNVAIGANCVVTKDIPDNAVVVGVPGRVISYQGSAGYVTRDYRTEP